MKVDRLDICEGLYNAGATGQTNQVEGGTALEGAGGHDAEYPNADFAQWGSSRFVQLSATGHRVCRCSEGQLLGRGDVFRVGYQALDFNH